MNSKKNMEGCQMSLAKNVKIDDVKSRFDAKVFTIRPIVN